MRRSTLIPAAFFLLLCLCLTGAVRADCNWRASTVVSPFHDEDTGRWSFEFENEPLDRALFIISERTGTEFVYEPRVTAGIEVSLRIRDAELGDSLDELLQPWGLEARRIRTGMYVIRYSLRSPLAGRELASDGFMERCRELSPDTEPVRTVALVRSLTVKEIILQLSLP